MSQTLFFCIAHEFGINPFKKRLWKSLLIPDQKEPKDITVGLVPGSMQEYITCQPGSRYVVFQTFRTERG